MKLIENLANGTYGVLSDNTSAGTGAHQTLTASAVNHTTVSGKFYLCWFTAGSGSAPCIVHGVEIDFDYV